MKLHKILDLQHKLTFSDDVSVIRDFINTFELNEKEGTNFKLSTEAVLHACDNIQELLKQSLFTIGDFIPPIKNAKEEYVYSIRTPKEPPFVAKTNDPEVINHIYKLFVKMGGWEEAKFLLENLRMNRKEANQGEKA